MSGANNAMLHPQPLQISLEFTHEFTTLVTPNYPTNPKPCSDVEVEIFGDGAAAEVADWPCFYPLAECADTHYQLVVALL